MSGRMDASEFEHHAPQQEMAAKDMNVETQRDQSPPFSVELLRAPAERIASASDAHKQQLLSRLPASFRTDRDDLAAASRDVRACLAKELDLQRLHDVFDWLWVAGRPMPPRPLHHQLLLGREAVVTEQMDMHLVWTKGRIFLKPIPPFLLDPAFWTEYLCCPSGSTCSDGGECGRRSLRRRALGFLFSYAALISHESDFILAKEKHLLPADAQWQVWRTLVEQLDTECIYARIDRRFFYGELRLSRLNKIYILSRRPFLRGYMSAWQEYGTFFQANFAWLASVTVYIAIVLTAMQVGLATKTLSNDDAFQSASYGFTVFSILAPLAATAMILLAFLYLFINNWFATEAYKKARFQHIQVRPDRP